LLQSQRGPGSRRKRLDHPEIGCASGSTGRWFWPDPVRHASVTTHHDPQRDTSKKARKAANIQLTGHFRRYWQVLGLAQQKRGQRFTDPLPLARLATASGVSQRTLTRLFGQATGMTPLRYQQLLRVERAEHLIGHGATVEAAARAAGFQDARMLRRLRARGHLDL
jgi:transcriptional regulator GlxA family with amidase domain